MRRRPSDHGRLNDRAGRRIAPEVEPVESRLLMATFTVTNTSDLDAPGAVVPGSLREAIRRPKALPDPDVINFSASATIRVQATQLDVTTSPVIIIGPGRGGIEI